MKNVADKSCREKTHVIFNKIFQKIVPFVR